MTERARLAGRVENLRRRARAMAILRRFFDERGFLEVETPLLVPSPGLELHLDAFPVGDRFLITSPEYQLKRLLAAGLDRVYAVAKCFRRGERGAQHNPEFTMVEWYRSPGRWQEIAADVEELAAAVARELRGDACIEYQGRRLDLAPPWQRLTVREAMARWAAIELAGDEPAAELARRGRAAGVPISPTLTSYDDVFFTIFLHAIDPALARNGPTILHDWPAPLAALARRKPADPQVVERFEAYAGGLELANGFGELTDPVEQRARFVREQAERAARGLPVYPIDERFLAALADGVPPSAGVALGIDRLLMLACDAAELRDVVTFASDEL